MTLSLCMIVKNERNNLPRCLDSVAGIVDEMIVVDTGSTDDTVQIAEGFGAQVSHFPWNGSFSDARNFSLSKAKGDWILLMDADDELEKPRRQEVRELAGRNEAEAYFFLTVSYLGSAPGLDVMNNLNIRLLKNGRGYFFSNPIHEQIYTNIKAVNPKAVILNEDIKVYHYGYLDSNIAAQDKRKRNIAMLEKELEQNPGYGFALFNMGSEYYAMGNNLKALEYYEKSHAKFDAPQGYSSKLLLKLANCYMNLGKFDDALATTEEGLGYYPELTDFMFIKALVYYFQLKYTAAARTFEKCVKMGEAPLALCVIAGAGTYRAQFMLGEIHFQFEDYETAAEHYSLSLKSNRDFTPSASKLVRSFCRMKPGRKELKGFLDDLACAGVGNFDSAAAEVLVDEGCYETALQYIKNARRKGANTELDFQSGMCALFLKKYRSAHCILDKLKNDPAYSAKAACIQALCAMLEKDFARAGELLSGVDDPNDVRAQVYAMLLKLLQTGEAGVLSEDEKASAPYTAVIFELLGILIDVREFGVFEKALPLLNAVTDKTVLLKLARLYYIKGCYGLAYQELIRSITAFGCIDAEGADILHKLKLKGYA